MRGSVLIVVAKSIIILFGWICFYLAKLVLLSTEAGRSWFKALGVDWKESNNEPTARHTDCDIYICNIDDRFQTSSTDQTSSFNLSPRLYGKCNPSSLFLVLSLHFSQGKTIQALPQGVRPHNHASGITSHKAKSSTYLA